MPASDSPVPPTTSSCRSTGAAAGSAYATPASATVSPPRQRATVPLLPLATKWYVAPAATVTAAGPVGVHSTA